jgi:hypothetical protein
VLNKPVRYEVIDADQGGLLGDICMLTEDLQALCDNTGTVLSKIQARCLAVN